MRIKAEGELKNRPPLITPRNSTIGALIPSIPGPVKSTSPQPAQPTKPTQPVQSSLPQKVDIYLEDFCPLTQKELETNPKHLDKFRRLAIDLFEKELDEFGIELNEKGLSLNDYKSKMNAIRNFRSERSDDMVKFSELRNVFSELSAKHAQQRLTSSLRSSSNRVHFKKEISQKNSKTITTMIQKTRQAIFMILCPKVRVTIIIVLKIIIMKIVKRQTMMFHCRMH